jgi:hypothetical protein
MPQAEEYRLATPLQAGTRGIEGLPEPPEGAREKTINLDLVQQQYNQMMRCATELLSDTAGIHFEAISIPSEGRVFEAPGNDGSPIQLEEKRNPSEHH